MRRALTWSFGGGTQSVAIACLVADGTLPRPDVIVMADTGYEATETWDYLEDHVRPLLGEVVVLPPAAFQTTNGLRARNGKILMPVFTSGGVGQLPNYCTNEWKVRPVRRYLRQQGYGPRQPVRTWIGISVDEIHRAKPSGRVWQEYHYPLLFDVSLRREDCRTLVRRFGLPDPPKSSCYFCPYRGNAQWRRLRDEYPQDWQRACEHDGAIRRHDPDAFVHRSGVSLEEAKIDTEGEQSDLFGEIECDSGYCWV